MEENLLQKWPDGNLNINAIPSDNEQLKKWLKCNLFVNQMFTEIGYTTPNGEYVVQKPIKEVARNFIKNIDGIVSDFMKEL